MKDYLNIYNVVFKKCDQYDRHNNNINRYDFIIDEIRKNKYKKIIDISSGRGVLIDILKKTFPNIEILSTDIKKFNNINVDFVVLDLTKNKDFYNIPNEKYDILLCLDVLEHIEKKYINKILQKLSNLSNNFCFTIANHSDVINNIELHLIQKNKKWWNKKLTKYFIIQRSFNLYDNRLYCYILKRKERKNIYFGNIIKFIKKIFMVKYLCKCKLTGKIEIV